jgi:hypothetical protein
MTKTKTNILTIFIIFCTLTTFAENKLARISDPDGFTNIRSGQGIEFAIIGRIDKSDLFYCDFSNNDWLKISALKWQNGKQVEGFVHKSKVQLIETLDRNEKQTLLTTILNKQKKLADNFRKSWKNKDSLAYRTTVRELENYSDIKYSPILEILPKYFCETKDTDILQLFFATMWSDKGSANETPSFTIGDCFICQTNIVLSQICSIKDNEQRNSIYSSIEWGLLNHFDIDENGKTDNQEFKKLKKELDIGRKRACR